MPKYRETVDVDGLPRPGTPPPRQPRQNGLGLVPRKKPTVTVTIQNIEVESGNPDMRGVPRDQEPTEAIQPDDSLRFAVGPTAATTEVVDPSFEGVTDIAEPDEDPQFELSRDVVIEDRPPPLSPQPKPRRRRKKKD